MGSLSDGGGPSTPTQRSQGTSQGERLDQDQDQGERLGRESKRLGREGERLDREGGRPVSYTHLTLPTNREV